MPTFIVKNNGAEEWLLLDTKPRIKILASGQSNLSEFLSWERLKASNQLSADIQNEALALVVNNGTDDLEARSAIIWIKNPAAMAQYPSRQTITGEIFLAAEPETQAPRLLDALDTHSSMLAALDNYNYPLAVLRVAKALSVGAIIQADYDLIVSKIPS